MRTLKLSLLLLLSTLFISSCSIDIDDDNRVGELELFFSNPGDFYEVAIFPIENENSPIHEVQVRNYSDFDFDLIPGNYTLKAYRNGNYYSSPVSFQILPGRTTEIIYDRDNSPRVEYHW